MGRRQRLQARLEPGEPVLGRSVGAERLLRQALDDGQGIAHPVVQLIDQQPLVLFPSLGFGDVLQHAAGLHDGPILGPDIFADAFHPADFAVRQQQPQQPAEGPDRGVGGVPSDPFEDRRLVFGMIAGPDLLDGQQMQGRIAVEFAEPGRRLHHAANMVVVEHRQPSRIQGRAQLRLAFAQRLLGLLAFSDVQEDAEGPSRTALVIKGDLRAHPVPAELPVQPIEAVLDLEEAIAGRHRRHPGRPQPLAFARMVAGAQLIEVGDRVRRIAEQPIERGGAPQGVGGEVVLPDRHASGFQRQPQVRRGGAAGLVFPPASGDVPEGDPQAIERRLDPHLDEQSVVHRGHADELVRLAAGHGDTVAALELGADKLGKHRPERLAQRGLPVEVEATLRRRVHGDQPPLPVDGVEAVRQAVEDTQGV